VAAIVGIAHITIELDESFSLKDKRRVVSSLAERLRHRFNVAVAEVENQDDWRLATLAAVCVSNNAGHADQMLAAVLAFAERALTDGRLGEVTTELIHVD
jgi:uncharacterized protein YlxP (DUF503 family)